MAHPLVVHCKKSPHDIYIGRPSRWGNPFSHLPDSLAEFSAASREDAIAKYEAWIKTQPSLLASLPALHGKVLGCWCAPLPCHGEVLVKLAEEAWRNQQANQGLAKKASNGC